MPILVQYRPQRIHQLGALMNEALTTAEQHRPGLLILRLGGEAHLGLACSDHDGFGIGSIVFWRLTKGLTYGGAMSLASWSSLAISRAQ